MRLALNLGYLVGGDSPQGQLALTRHAEALGFEVVWAAEAYGSDAPTVLAWLAGQTTRIGIGSAVLQIPARTPAMTAMTAATLDLISDGRFSLGLGVSGPQVSEGWHGVRFDRPLARTREFVEVLDLALGRQPVVHEGRHYPLPLPDGPGKALRLTIRPPRDHIPRYLAAVGPKNLQLAGELFDGWLAVFFAPDHAEEQLTHLSAGLEISGRTLADFDVTATVPLVVGDDPQVCADPLRPYAALYVGGMGSREQNFYNQLAVRMGYEKEAALVQDLYLDGRPRDAMAAMPYEFIDSTSLLGGKERLAERLRAFAESGLNTCSIAPQGGSVEEKISALTTLVEAYELAGLS